MPLDTEHALRELMHPLDQMSLTKRVFSAGAWSVFGFGLSMTIRFGSSLLLTRLLVPEVFGLMGIATIVMVGLTMLSDIGIRMNVIQSKRGHDPAFLNTAWVTQILRGLALWIIAIIISSLFLISDHIELFPKDSTYADQSLPYVIAVMSVTILIGSFQSTKAYEAGRHLRLARITQIDIAAQLFGLLCTLTWVFIDRSIWALIAGGIGSTLVSVTASHIYLPGVANRWQWDQSASREIIHFGKWILVSSLLGFLVNNGDRLLLGGLVNAKVLGVYAIAFNFISIVELVLVKIIGDVSYPALGEIARERPHDLKMTYYKFHFVIASFAYVCAGIFSVSGQSLISFLYDSRYQQAGWILQMLAPALLTIPFRIAAAAILAMGDSRSFSKIIEIRVVVLFLSLPFGFYFFGLPGAVAGIVAGYFASLFATIFYQFRYDLFDLRKELLLLMTVPVGMIFGEVGNLIAPHLKLH